MSKIIQCPACSTKLKLGEASAHKTVIACPACSQKIRVRSDDDATPPRRPKPTAKPKRSAPERPVRESRSESRSRSGSRSRSEQREERAPRSRAEERRPPRSGKKKSASRSKSGNGTSPLMVGLIGAGSAIGVMAVVGGIWWWMNSGDSPSDSGGQAVVQTDPNVNGSVDPQPETNSTGTNPSTPGTSPAPNTDPAPANPGESNPAPTTPIPSFGSTPNAPGNNAPPTNPGVQPGGQQPPAGGHPVVAQANSEVLKYGWNDGDTHVYNYELNAEIEGKSRRFPGSVTLTVRASQNKGRDESTTGTGTGFVITPDGYMLTCHHVTEGATSIQVALSGRTYPARVIASNRANDLAIIKVDGNNLPTVPLANSDSVQLAEEVRAIGYPLTTLLGQGIKVTRGTISGIDKGPDGKGFQIDAAINPGNSGGPLFNARGQVIGINSAKLLAGSSISSVGFSVPVNHAKALLQQKGIPFTPKDGGATLAGPALVNQVKPAIALLTVESRSRSFDQYVLSYSGSYTQPSSSSGRATRGGRMGIGIPRGPIGFSSNRTSSRGKVVLDVFGEVATYEDTAQLPFTTGSMAMLMIHQLDPDGARSWSHENKFQLTKPKKQQSNSPFGFGGPRFRGGPFGQPEQREPDEVLMDGVEIYRYRITESSDKEVKIFKDYELRTLDHPTNPYTLITGQGTITFDKTMALPRTMEYRQTFQHNSDNVSVKIPISITYRMQDPEILAKAQRDAAAKAAQAKAEKEAQSAAEAAMSPEERVDFYIAEIKAKRGDQVYGKLAAMDVVESKRKQVCDLLLPTMNDKWNRRKVIGALGKWATPKVVTMLIETMEASGTSDWPYGQQLLTALGNTGDERAIKTVAKYLNGPHTLNRQAKSAILKFGPAAEDEVLKVLAAKPSREMCQVLAVIGTSKSKEPLQKLLAHKDHWIKRDAGEALGKIVAREAGGGAGASTSPPSDTTSATTASAGRRANSMVERLKKLGPDSPQVAMLLTRLKSTPVNKSLRPDMEEFLIQCVSSKNPTVRTSSVSALSKWGSPKSAPAIADSLADSSATPTYLVLALTTLKTLGESSVAPKVVSLLSHDDASVKDTATLTLETIGAGAEKELIALLDNESVDLRRRAVSILGATGRNDAVYALQNREKTEADVKLKSTIGRTVEKMKNRLK